MGWREVRDKARGQVHSTFGLPATYTAPAGTPVACTVRVTDSMVAVGDFDSNGMAERMASVPEAIFLISEVPTPAVGALVAVTNGRTYRIEYVYPADGITVKAELSRA